MSQDAILGRYFLNKPGITLIRRDHVILRYELPENDLMLINEIETENKTVDLSSTTVDQKVPFDLKKQLQSMLDEYEQNFESPDPIDFKMELRLTSDKPFYFKPRRLSYLELLKLKEIIDKLLKLGYIRRSRSCYSSQYTTVCTLEGQYEYLRISFGLTNSFSYFQRYLCSIFKELIEAGKLLVYLDDFLIATQTIEENWAILEEVFVLMAKNGLKLRLDKCVFGVREIQYLGYVINAEGIKSSREHVKSLLEYPIPKSVLQVQKFLGLVGFVRRFIPNFATKAKPLYDLLRKGAEFKFGEPQLRAFETLIECMVTEPVLAIYSRTANTELHTDASSLDFGAILLQKQEDNHWHPVYYYSKRTSREECNYHSYELELLAIVYATRKFRVYLLGKPFLIRTDCSAVKCALEKKKLI